MDCIPNWTKWHFKNHIQYCDKEKNVWIWSGGYDIRPWLGWRPASWGYCQPMFFSSFFYYGVGHKLGSFNDLQNLYGSQKWLASQLHSFCDRRWSSILSRSAEDWEFPKVSRHIHIIPGVDKGCGICKWLQPRSLLASMLLLLKSPLFLIHNIYTTMKILAIQ